ncbi:MAG: aminoacyl-tRNA deacylase [Clostridia bacterium]|nr:aminoacyl-tRNA deacylase [Clostridia bacterium]
MAELTNAIRLLKDAGAFVAAHESANEFSDAGELAELLGLDPDRVFKTLVTVGKSGAHHVFIVPSREKLDLKKAASVCGEKYVEMIPQKDLLKTTGYVHGGCSPVGMKKQFETFIDETCVLFDEICFSAGRVGELAEVRTEVFLEKFNVKTAELT